MRGWIGCAMGVMLCASCGGGEDAAPTGRVLFGFPVAQPELTDQYIGVDHDPEVQRGDAEGLPTLGCAEANE